MDALTLARIQFALGVGTHFLVVPLSIGLSVVIVLAERRYRRTGLPADRAASDFWIRLFTTTFALGVAGGIANEFAFGTNWSSYSRFVGDIFGAPLAAEGVFAFFLESTFLGVLLFGRNRVSDRFYYASTWLVAAGAHLSALWIIIANSWQQTPAGMEIVGGRAVLTDFFAAAFNPSTVPRYFHTVVSTWTAGAFLAAAICAYYLLRRREVGFARATMPMALVVAMLGSLAMPVIGHFHAEQVAATQPIKLAAFEGIFKSEDYAGLVLFGVVDQANHEVAARVVIPGLLSQLLGGVTTRVQGLDTVSPSDWPPLQLTFQSYHLMVSLGMLFVAVAAVALIQWRRRRLEDSKWLLRALIVTAPLVLVAIESGWVAAEVGRQPWIVQGLLRTSDGLSKVVPTWQIGLSFTVFLAIYALLFYGWLRIFFGYIRRGPAAEEIPATQPTGVPGHTR